jgi:hypothetical protein
VLCCLQLLVSLAVFYPACLPALYSGVGAVTAQRWMCKVCQVFQEERISHPSNSTLQNQVVGRGT